MTEDPFRERLPDETERVASEIVDSAFKIHKALGPGLLESVYEVCMARELSKRRLKFQTQVSVPVEYDEIKLDVGFRADIIVEDSIIIELKAVEQLTGLHEAQLLTYMKLTNIRLGLLINFNVPIIKRGIKRLIL